MQMYLLLCIIGCRVVDSNQRLQTDSQDFQSALGVEQLLSRVFYLLCRSRSYMRPFTPPFPEGAVPTPQTTNSPVELWKLTTYTVRSSAEATAKSDFVGWKHNWEAGPW